jgi:hypothetical protein
LTLLTPFPFSYAVMVGNDFVAAMSSVPVE